VTVWGTSETEPQTPLISTLNVPTGTVTANAALVTINPSTSESVSVYSSNDTNLVLDITGYFAPASLAPSGLSLYTLPPCRVIDTRESSGEFQGELTVPFATGNNCSIPTNAQAYVVNATVVPSGPLGFLTLWPDGIPQPLVSTLNAEDGSVTSNMAIVSTTNGSIDAFATSDTQLILDVSGYFASPPGPTVVFVGDQVTINMFTPTFQQQHPNWVDAAIAGQTTAQALAAFQAQCISPHPQVCHVMIGLNDIQAWLPYPPGDANIESQELQVLQDLSQMLQGAAAAGIQVVFATEFPSFEDFSSDDEVPPVDVYADNINAWLTGFVPMGPSDWPPAPTTAVIANYWVPLTGNCGFFDDECDYLPGLSTDDIVPNAAGYAAMYPVLASAVQQALSSTPSSSAKPTMPLTNKAEKADF
jgi:lysophospholipase L1-like esterase